jgi:hypothetical protein
MSWNNSIKQRLKSQAEKFWEKVDIQGIDDCWEWLASRNNKGYGNFYISLGHSEDKHILATRMSWTLTYGDIPEGLCVLHKCDNPPCVNPHHLFLGTKKDNADDMTKKGRNKVIFRKGEAHYGSKLTNSDVIMIRHLRKKGLTLFVIADMYNIHYSTVGYIVKGKLWKHIPLD